MPVRPPASRPLLPQLCSLVLRPGWEGPLHSPPASPPRACLHSPHPDGQKAGLPGSPAQVELKGGVSFGIGKGREEPRYSS